MIRISAGRGGAPEINKLLDKCNGGNIMTYDPRTATGIPTEPVGSLPRPLKLQQAYVAYDAKKITKEQLQAEQQAAVEDTIKRFEASGSPIITDGEQRISSFATYPIADTLAGTGLRPISRAAVSISPSSRMATTGSCRR